MFWFGLECVFVICVGWKCVWYGVGFLWFAFVVWLVFWWFSRLVWFSGVDFGFASGCERCLHALL